LTSETKIGFLEHFPTTIFKQLIDKWQKTSIELQPKNLLSGKNLDQVIDITKNLSASKIKILTKLSETLNISEVWWDLYHITKIQPTSLLKKQKKEFSVTKYFENDQAKVKGIFTTLELSEQAIFIHIEFSARAAALRNNFRFIYFPTAKKILVEPKEQALDVLKNDILPLITKEPNKAIKKPVRAREIKNFTKKDEQSESAIVITNLTIKISLETSGIEGLSHISIHGDDVIRGAETLEQRHEISLKFMDSGPWTGAGTKDFKLEVGKGIQVHQLEKSSLKNLATVLNWF